MEKNKIYNMDCVEYMKSLPDECVDLIIADPPYYKAINEKWDKQWRTEEEYLNWTQQWFNECVRILKPTGVFYCYGNFDILSKQKVLIFDKQLNFRQNITLSKGLRAIAGRTSDKLRMFPTASEYLLYYVKQEDYNEKQMLITPMREIRDYLNSERLKWGKSLDDMCRYLGLNDKGHGGVAYHWCSSKQPSLIPKKHYLKLQLTTNYFKKPYEELLDIMNNAKQYYLNNRYVFNLPTGVTDVWEFIPDKVRYGHKTQKPKDITDRIIKASSNKGDLVYIPFAGSGSEVVSCINNNRNYLATEINKKYIDEIIIPRIETNM